MTRDDFIKRWRLHLAGLALYGIASEVKDGLLVRAGRVLEIPQEVERLLGRMYDELQQAKPPPPNGAAQTQQPQRRTTT